LTADGYDENGLKLEKIGTIFQILPLFLGKSPETDCGLLSLSENHSISFS